MRATRAYIAGVGTTTLLVAAAVLLLLVVSTLVAFRGWPGSDVSAGVADLVLGEPEPVELQQAAPGAGFVTAATAGAAPALAGDVADTPPAGGDPVSESPAGAPGGDFSPERGAGQGGGGPSAAPPSQPASPAPVGDVTQGLGDTARGVTDGAGEAVGQVAPGLGGTVTETGRRLSDVAGAVGSP